MATRSLSTGAKALSALAVFSAAVSLTNACQSSGAVTGGAACALGDRIPCSGVDGCAGSAACLPDLSAFGDCECEAAGAPSNDAASRAKDGGTRDASKDSG